jgi:hypothetical protein
LIQLGQSTNGKLGYPSVSCDDPLFICALPMESSKKLPPVPPVDLANSALPLPHHDIAPPAPSKANEEKSPQPSRPSSKDHKRAAPSALDFTQLRSASSDPSLASRESVRNGKTRSFQANGMGSMGVGSNSRLSSPSTLPVDLASLATCSSPRGDYGSSKVLSAQTPTRTLVETSVGMYCEVALQMVFVPLWFLHDNC